MRSTDKQEKNETFLWTSSDQNMSVVRIFPGSSLQTYQEAGLSVEFRPSQVDSQTLASHWVRPVGICKLKYNDKFILIYMSHICL